MIYLYVKQHNTTGLKYFGKTVAKNPYSYEGSGTYWKRHLKTHGNDISTLEVWEFDNQADCTSFALQYSNEHNIIESPEWANLIVENGVDGLPAGYKHSEETKAKISASTQGRKLPPDVLERFKKVNVGRVFSDEHKRKLSIAAQARENARKVQS